ncbi:MAG: CocE/NonD family hydrolase [Pseudomonadota bacterium]
MKRRDFLIATSLATSSIACSKEPESVNRVVDSSAGKGVKTDIRIANIFPAAGISEKKYTDTIILNNVMTPMRDGVHLASDILRPNAPGRFPAVLMRTPYNKVAARDRSFYKSLVQRGYIVVLQDCRGRYNSDGEFYPYKNERNDGYDAVEWTAKQPWCDGNVGMDGASYAGGNQWFAAMDAPPHLKAIIPSVAQWDAFFNEPIRNGCFLMPVLEWMHAMGKRSQQYQPDFRWYSEHQSYFDALPLSAGAGAGGSQSSWWESWMDHPNLDDFWRASSYSSDWREINVPALNITGWWDMGFPSSPGAFLSMRQHAQSSSIVAGQQMIIGPWHHSVNKDRGLNGVDFGEQAIVNLDEYKIRFLDRWLKGDKNGLDNDPRVQVFVIGANKWRTADAWPMPGTDFTQFYFHSHGDANTSNGGGALSRTAPGDEPSDGFTYDPSNPIGMLWKLLDGPVDDQLVSQREDMLCYTTEALNEPLDVVGPVSCVLYGSSSALDTDWHVRLVDVHPNGEARYLCHGALRARFRRSFSDPKLLEPNKVYKFDIGMDACGIRFLPGHRIRIEVMSSWFPRYDRNTNSGAVNNFRDDTLVIANNRIYHDAAHPSHVVLPLVRGTTES